MIWIFNTYYANFVTIDVIYIVKVKHDALIYR